MENFYDLGGLGESADDPWICKGIVGWFPSLRGIGGIRWTLQGIGAPVGSTGPLHHDEIWYTHLIHALG